MRLLLLTLLVPFYPLSGHATLNAGERIPRAETEVLLQQSVLASSVTRFSETGKHSTPGVAVNSTFFTQLKNQLDRDPAHAETLRKLEQGSPEEVREALQEIHRLGREAFGLPPGELVFYDSATVGDAALADGWEGGVYRDRQGATAVKTGTIYIDQNAARLSLLNTLAHELMEVQALGSLQTQADVAAKEAMALDLGRHFASRLNAATEGVLEGQYSGRPSARFDYLLDMGSNAAQQFAHGEGRYRQLTLPEAQALARVEARIAQNSALSAEEKQVEKAHVRALVCAETRCSAGVPVSDVHYGQLKTLEEQGKQLIAGGAVLTDRLDASAQGLFGYSRLNQFEDSARKHDETITRAEGGVNLVVGSTIAAHGAATATAMAPACVTIAGCAAPAAFVGLSALGYQQAQAGAKTLFGDYSSREGQRVLDAFSVRDHPGDTSRLTEIGISATLWAAEALALKGFNRLTKGSLSPTPDKVFSNKVGGVTEGTGSAKNASGSLDDAARAARTQPHNTPNITQHARYRMIVRDVSYERVLEAINRGTIKSKPGSPVVERNLSASESASGRGISVRQDVRTNNVVTVIDMGSKR